MHSVQRVYNTAPGLDPHRMMHNDRQRAASDARALRLALLLISGGAVCFAIALLAPAAARQTVALMGRSGTESESAELADAAAVAIESLATLVVAAGAVIWWRARAGLGSARAATVPAQNPPARIASSRTSAMVLAGGSLWCAATAALAWITLWGQPTALRVGPSLWITPAGASLALGAIQLLGASLIVQGLRPGVRMLGTRSDTQAEARSAVAALDAATVSAAVVIGSRLFALVLPSLGWSLWTPVARGAMNVAGLMLALTVIWGFVACWQVARARPRTAAESAA